MNRSKFQFSNPELEKIEFSVNQNFEVQMLEGNEALVKLTLSIGNSTDSQPFDICVKMGANFTWDESVEIEKAKQLLNINAPAVLLSYIRPIVSSMTNSSKYPTLNIPFIDFTKKES